MNPQITESINRIADGARANFRAAVSGARGRSMQAAQRVVETRRPLEALTGVGLKLSAVSHRTTDRVLKQNMQLAVHQLDAVAERLESAATAACLRDLIRKQIKLTPAHVSRFGRDARESLTIVAEGGMEAGDVLKSAVSALKSSATAPAKRKTKTARKRPAKKAAARKTPARKARASAKKTATRRKAATAPAATPAS